MDRITVASWAPMVVSPALFVVLRRSGLTVWTGDDPPPLDIGFAELVALESLRVPAADPLGDVLDSVASATGVDAPGLMEFVNELRSRRLLVDADPSLTAVPEPRSPSRGALSVGTGPAASDAAALGPADAMLVAESPLVFRLTADGFETLDHDGRLRARLDATELIAFRAFAEPGTLADAHERHRHATGPRAVDPEIFGRLATVLWRTGLLSPFDPSDPGGRENRDARMIYRSFLRMSQATDQAVAVHEANEHKREQRSGTTRVRVVPLDHRAFPAPLSLGMIIAYAQAYKGGVLDEHFQFVPAWITRPDRLSEVPPRGAVYVCSNYIWSHGHNLAMSATVKKASPWSLTVHGGPDTPKYRGDVEQYLLENPQVDIAVHGEGEATFAELLEALAGAVGDGPPDLSRLHDVAGLSFREGGEIVHTADRERISDLDVIPSPFLTGVFDVHATAGFTLAIIETNRGCPYGCTFCDWGSATLARIRKFDLERVFAELEWCAQHEVERIFVADANFGIFERDVEIAEKVAALKDAYGFPKLFSTNYAKNTTKHLRRIVETFGRAGILTQGLLSLQTMDPATLKTVKRSNIKTEKYDDLAREFRKADLPLFVDLMLGLPGATTASFRDDLQQCVDREITAKVYPTELLVNSPMNEPGYRQAQQIETSAPLGSLVRTSREPDGSTKRALLVSSASYTRDDYAEMLDLRRVFTMAENFGVLRQISRYVRQEIALTEIDLYDRLREAARERPERWPALAFTFHVGPFLGVAPVSWALLIDELKRYLTLELGVVADDALETALTVQHALLPARDRRFPLTLALAHDYSSWHRAMVEVKDAGHRDWTERVPRLRELAPAGFHVDDPHQVCRRGIGYEIEANLHGSWELASSVARAVSHEHQWDE